MKYVISFKNRYPFLLEWAEVGVVATAIFMLLFGTVLLLCYLVDSFVVYPKVTLTIEQEYAIENIRDDLKREAFKDCLQRSNFDTCYIKYTRRHR